MIGAKMFENRRAENLFADLSDTLTGSKKAKFSNGVRALFDKKLVSEDGEFKSFKLDEKDVARIYDAVVLPISREDFESHDCHASEDDGCGVCVAWADQNNLAVV